MNLNDLKKAAAPVIDANITAQFELDGQTYDVFYFSTEFNQEVDHKDQPQSETHGGRIKLILSQIVPDSIYQWAKAHDMRKDGAILFQTKTSGTVLKVGFENAHCVSLSRGLSASSGTKTVLTIAPEFITVGKTTHDNRWGE